MKFDNLITMASWEDRFVLGFKRNYIDYNFKKCIMYYYDDYSVKTAKNRKDVDLFCKENGIYIDSCGLKNPKDCWIKIFKNLQDLNLANINVLVDITTMPREIIWTVFDLLDTSEAKFGYVYYKPSEYSKDWLSRDPGKPRIVYKLSGIAKLGLPTKLLIITGFDVDRIKQLIHFYEPVKTLLGVQEGNQFDNYELNERKIKNELYVQDGIEIFNIDSYSNDHGFETIASKLQAHLDDSNILMSSLGPKISAVSLYKIQKKYKRPGLTYAPSREYNSDYSKGIGDKIFGTLK